MKIKILVAALIVGMQFTVFAQQGKTKKSRIAHLTNALDLSDDQAEQVKEIFEKYKAEATKENRDEIRESIKTDISEILSEEQLAKYEEITENGKGRSRAGKQKGARKRGMKRARSEKDAEVTARLLDMRAELEEDLSEEDKESLAELRTSISEIKETFKAKKEAYKDLTKEERKALKEELKPLHEDLKTDLKAAKELATNYKEEIKSIFEENKTFFDEKKAETKEEWKAKKEAWKEKKKEWKENRESGDKPYRDKDAKEARQKQTQGAKGRQGHRAKQTSKGVHFILLDPNGSAPDTGELIEEFNSISIAPNPANAITNVSFEVKQDGMIRVDIRDESGKVYETIANEQMQPGTYTRSVNTNKYLDKIYYVSISDGKSVQTKKLIILK